MTTTTTTSPPAPTIVRHPRTRARRRSVQAILTVLVLIVLLAPVAFLFTRLWTSVGDSAATTDDERAAVAYARPVNKLLAALVDAQYAAVLRTRVDPTSVRSAVDDVNAVDRQADDPLQVRQRWIRLSSEINDVLSQNTSGPDALASYASPIALTQALLSQIADAAKVTKDSGPGSYQLTQVALRSLPDVVANAGQLGALTSTVDTPSSTRSARPALDPRLTIAKDRLTQSAAEVSTGLRAGTDPGANYTVDLSLLGPLDEFTAAADDLSQAADGLEVPGSGANERVATANAVVKTKALALESAVLDAFDAQLTTDASGYSGERRTLVLAAVIILLAAGALLWLRPPWLVEPRPAAPEGLDQAEGRHSYPSDGPDAAPDGTPRVPDLVDARELLPHAANPNGPNGSLGRSQEAAGSRWS
jgi:hypothetical protein